MTAVDWGAGDHRLPPHAHLREGATEYVVELDVSDFTDRELTVEVLGRRVVVCGEQLRPERGNDAPFQLHERLEETFCVPDDADVDELSAVYRHGTLDLRVPRQELRPRQVAVTHEPSLVHPNAECV
ncbi:MAG: Hsp20/alpha crystallin family protein [Gaiellaceae bacterium]